MRTKALATCSSCGQTSETTLYSGINTSSEPELKSKVKDGSLFLWECPHCGKTNLAASQLVYHDPEERLMIWLLPEGSLPENSVRTIERNLESAAESLDGYTFRRVDDAGSLIEKVNIFDSGLEDTVIEMVKYVTKMELAPKSEGKDVMDAPMKFFRIEGPDHELTFTYPSGGQMRGVQIGFNVYEDCAGILRRNPSIKPSPGFSRIDQGWVARFFR
ncbi:MAG: CpXC domain-containing protein [Bacteroidales bacterium]|nr:CpXC domain-containing protein [Bacteroidales bacterium]